MSDSYGPYEIILKVKSDLRGACLLLGSLSSYKEWAEYKEVPLPPVEGAPIFSRERVEQNIVAYTSDLSALRVAYLIEKDAVDFYRRAARETDDPNGKRIYLDLARMEESHLALLQGEYDFLRGQFQTAMGFAPF